MQSRGRVAKNVDYAKLNQQGKNNEGGGDMTLGVGDNGEKESGSSIIKASDQLKYIDFDSF
jgi:hypothetical protein